MGSCAGIQLAERPSFYSQYILQEKIGQGSYGKVYLAKDKRSGRVSAVKVQAAQFGREWVILDEVIVWRALGRHPNIVCFYDLRQEANVFFILMEVCPRALSDRVMSAPKWTTLELSNDYYQALLGVQHMHNRRIVHRDIKVQNFLYGGNDGRTLKLADFGLSVEIHPGEKLEAVCGSPAFMAPEMVLRQGYDFKIDMWSLGVTFFMVMHGTLLVGKPKMSVSEMKEAIKSPNATKASMMNAMTKADSLTGDLRELKMQALDVVRQLTVRDPLHRVGPKEALELQFLQLGQQATWEQKLRLEKVLIVDRPPASKKKAVTEGNVQGGKASQEKPRTDFSPVVPQSSHDLPGEPKNEVPMPTLQSGPKKFKQRSKSAVNQLHPESLESRRLSERLPIELDTPRRGGAAISGEIGQSGGGSSLKIQRYRSLGDMGSPRAKFGVESMGPGGLHESGDSIRMSVAACLMQAYRGGSRRIIDSGLPGQSRGLMSPDNSFALGNFAESFGQGPSDDALRRFAQSSPQSPAAGTRSGNAAPASSSSGNPMTLQMQAPATGMRVGHVPSFASPGASLKEENKEDVEASDLPCLPAKLPGTVEVQSPRT